MSKEMSAEAKRAILIEEALLGKDASEDVLKGLETIRTLMSSKTTTDEVTLSFLSGLKMNFTGMKLAYQGILDEVLESKHS